MVLEGHALEGQERVLLVSAVTWPGPAVVLINARSCFNAFSRVDVRVDVKIPGGVQAYVVDLRGERCVPLFNPSTPCLN